MTRPPRSDSRGGATDAVVLGVIALINRIAPLWILTSGRRQPNGVRALDLGETVARHASLGNAPNSRLICVGANILTAVVQPDGPCGSRRGCRYRPTTTQKSVLESAGSLGTPSESRDRNPAWFYTDIESLCSTASQQRPRESVAFDGLNQ